jgi:tryptophan halogenase
MSRSGPIERIVICGGGSAGWMTAAALAKMLGKQGPRIVLIESEEIGTVGVGEATIPPIVQFNTMLGIDEHEFVRETQATFKLGIEFVDWQRPGMRYMHPFGQFGADMNETSFIHFWHRAVSLGLVPDLAPFSTETLAAYRGLFAPRANNRPDGAKIYYAYQFDAAAYAGYLRRFAERLGVQRIEGLVNHVDVNGEDGFIEAVSLADGRSIGGDLFVDCSGFRALLIGDAMGEPYEDWSRLLPANRAVAVASSPVEDPLPYTRATAREAGWQWHIPLQHRTGNGYVFCDSFLPEEDAMRLLLHRLDGEPLGEPRVLRFTSGRRRHGWVRNCISIGLSSGFLEPLESTSIHLIQVAINSLLTLFPDRSCQTSLRNRHNEKIDGLTCGIRDFIIAHYFVTQRDDTDFWRYCKTMNVPESLSEKLEFFRSRGEVLTTTSDLFKEVNWAALLIGQGLQPTGWHPLANAMSNQDIHSNLGLISKAIAARLIDMPGHASLLRARGNSRAI